MSVTRSEVTPVAQNRQSPSPSAGAGASEDEIIEATFRTHNDRVLADA